MMTLAQASNYFDRTPVTDPYTGSLLFHAQVEPFEDSKRDAYSAYRRVMSTNPSVSIPAHRVVDLLGQRWIVGQDEPDGMQSLHRRKYVISPVGVELSVSSMNQFVAGVSAYKVFASVHWLKDVKQESVSSEHPQSFEVFLPLMVTPRQILWGPSGAYLVLSPRMMPSGFVAALCLKLETQVEQVRLVTRVYNPVAGEYTVTNPAGTPVNALRVRWQSLFENSSESDRKYENGDVSVVLPTGTLVPPGTQLRFADRTYQALGTDNFGGAVVVHARGT